MPRIVIAGWSTILKVVLLKMKLQVYPHELMYGNVLQNIAHPHNKFELVEDIQTKGLESPLINGLPIESWRPAMLSVHWLRVLGFKDVSSDQNGWGLRLHFPVESKWHSLEFAWYLQDNHMQTNTIDLIRWQSVWSGFTQQHNVSTVHRLQNLVYQLTDVRLVPDLNGKPLFLDPRLKIKDLE